MSSRFENWFLNFVAEHNTLAAGLGGGGQVNKGYKGIADSTAQTALEPLSVPNDNWQVWGANVLSFRPADAYSAGKLSVA